MGAILSAVDVAAEFRQELALLDGAAVDSMLGAWQGVDAALLEAMEAFAGRFSPGASLTPGQVLRMRRYQALYAQVEAQLAAMERVAAATIEAGTAQAVGLGTQQAVASLDALGVGIGFNRLPVAAVENVVSLARAGRPLAQLLEPMYGAAADGIIRELVNGVALGLGPRAIARRMAADGLTDGLNHLLLVTRDQYNRAHRAASLETYRESGVVTGYVRRCARQAGRTCIACIALDGTFYTLASDFEEHPQGRCTMIPAVRGVALSPLGSGQAWFEGLDEDAQIATMGRGRWEAWQAGELGWGDGAAAGASGVGGECDAGGGWETGIVRLIGINLTVILLRFKPLSERVLPFSCGHAPRLRLRQLLFCFLRHGMPRGAMRLLIKKPVSCPTMFGYLPRFFDRRIFGFGVLGQNDHFDVAAIGSHPTVLRAALLIVTRMGHHTNIGVHRASNVTNLITTLQAQAIDVKHKILRALSSRRIGFTISAVTAADTGCHHPPGVLTHSLGTCFSTRNYSSNER